ncbi:hypothetical protein Patl_3237 [Paraglaciecola sp. T6c]|uniref:hypothetical protein n=1 Tax=Pseudoalteromonas atlantica (strain T6c / ATCC BAA-1087) TaxID=3042615 RepID=UPI00005C6DD6|nr:hypothetical protein [Paraglaciecola sp. T6c]ABG41743.1 hypothetical protein Patl_3237 [Paraglaciecola sp. T6c]
MIKSPIRNKMCIGALSLLASVADADVYTSIHESKTVEASGFECAEEALHVMDVLGRGPKFPEFLIKDVEIELNRQNKGAHLVSISCVGKPELMARNVADSQNNSGQSVLSALSVSFPLHLEVQNREGVKNTTSLDIEQNYLVENLDTGNLPTVTQNFIVKSSN